MAGSRVPHSGSWKTPTAYHVPDQGAWAAAKEIWVPAEVSGDPGTYIWQRVFWLDPTATPTIVGISAPADYEIRCEVSTYVGTYPTYNVYFELVDNSDNSLIASFNGSVGDTVHTFTGLGAYDGTVVKFRARYDDEGQAGPFSGYSGTATISGGL